MAMSPEQSISPEELEKGINTEQANIRKEKNSEVVRSALKSTGVESFNDGYKGEELNAPIQKDGKPDQRLKPTESYRPPNPTQIENKPPTENSDDTLDLTEDMVVADKSRKLGLSQEEKQALRLFKFAKENPNTSIPVSKKGYDYLIDKANASDNLTDQEREDEIAAINRMEVTNPDQKSLKELMAQAESRQNSQEENKPTKSSEEIMNDLKKRSAEEKKIHEKNAENIKQKNAEARKKYARKLFEAQNAKQIKALDDEIDKVRAGIQKDKATIDSSKTQIEQRLEERKPDEEEYGDNFTIRGRLKTGLKKVGRFFGFGRRK